MIELASALGCLESIMDTGKTLIDRSNLMKIQAAKIQALNIQVGDRIVAYCNNKKQTCIVKQVLDSDQSVITLAVSTSKSKHYRSSISWTVRFCQDALVELAA